MNYNLGLDGVWGRISYFAAIRGMVTEAKKSIGMIRTLSFLGVAVVIIVAGLNSERKRISFIIFTFLGLCGLFYLQGMEYITSEIWGLSAGGIFYMLHYVMISKIQKDGKWLPTFGSVFGFVTGFAMITTTWWVPITQT